MRTILPVATLVLLATPAAAQDTTGRYVMDRTEDGWVRMDSDTGEITLCRRVGDHLNCESDRPGKAAPADANRLAALEQRIEALEKRLDDSGNDRRALPSDQEFDKALGYMRRFFESFRDMVRDLGGRGRTAGEALDHRLGRFAPLRVV